MPFISAWPPATDKPGPRLFSALEISRREKERERERYLRFHPSILTRERVCFIRNDDVCFGGGKKRIDDE